ncbi:MAG: glycosyltransferase family 39 protein [Planctomycetota bacterium]|nr:glycosyltransferase family 39 protein [Planctomycetota bacterium]
MQFVRWREFLFVLGLTVLSLWLRWNAARQSLWLDELHTAWVVADDFRHIDLRARQGNSTPVYFTLVWLISNLVGPSAISLRGLSIGCGTVLVPVAFYLMRSWTGSSCAAALTAVLIALDSDFIFFASEARPYAMVQFLTLTHVAIFWNLWQAERVTRVAASWGCIAAILLWTHITSVWLVLAEFVFLVVTPRGRTLLQQNRFWYGSLIPLAALAMLGRRLGELLARRENWQLFVPQPTWQGVIEMFPITSYVLVPCLCLGLCWLVNVSLRAVRVGGNGLGQEIKENWRQLSPFLLWSACWFVVPMVGALVLTEWDWARLFFRRYLMVASLAPLILGGVVTSLASKRRSQCAILLCVLCWCHGATFLRFVRTGDWPLPNRHQDWASAATRIASRKDAPWPIMLDAGLIETPWLTARPIDEWDAWRDYLLFPLRSIYDTGIPPKMQIPIASRSDAPLKDEDLVQLDSATGAWLLLSASNDGIALDRVLRQLQLRQRAWRMRQVDSFGSLRLFELQVEASATDPPFKSGYQTE